MASKDRKRYLEYQEFKKWKAEQKKYRKVYESSESFHRNIFEDFKQKVIQGEVRSFNDISDPVLKVGTLRMVLDELDDVTHKSLYLPSLRFKSEWDVQVMPGFFGAFTRFRVNGYISVYLDFYNRLGFAPGPYWEVYAGDDPVRFPMRDTISVIDHISSIIEGEKSIAN